MTTSQILCIKCPHYLTGINEIGDLRYNPGLCKQQRRIWPQTTRVSQSENTEAALSQWHEFWAGLHVCQNSVNIFVPFFLLRCFVHNIKMIKVEKRDMRFHCYSVYYPSVICSWIVSNKQNRSLKSLTK